MKRIFFLMSIVFVVVLFGGMGNGFAKTSTEGSERNDTLKDIIEIIMPSATLKYGEELSGMPERKSNILFSDVPETHWAFKFINSMVEKKVLNGYPDGLFRPNREITRAEFSRIIMGAAGIEPKKVDATSFDDIVPSDWFAPFVESARDYLTGYLRADGKLVFKPQDLALREDITIAVVKLKGYDTKFADRSILEAMFLDYDSISEIAKDYVAIAVENGLISGFPDSTFRAQDTLTRAEASTILYRAFLFGNENKVLINYDVNSKINGETHFNATDEKNQSPPVTESKKVENSENIEKEKGFVVETLVGGNGFGQLDGNSIIARIGNVWSMVLDENDDIYFLDSFNQDYKGTGSMQQFSTGSWDIRNEDVDYDSQKVRVFDKDTLEVETLLRPRHDFFSKITDEDTGKTRHYNSFNGYKLVSDNNNGKVYLSGKYTANSNSDNPDYRGILFEIKPNFKESVTDKSFNHLFGTNDMAIINPNGSIVYSKMNNAKYIDLYRLTPNGTSTLYASVASHSFWHANGMDGIISEGKLFLLPFKRSDVESQRGAFLETYDMATGKLQRVESFEGDYSSVKAYNGDFYVSKGGNIYKITVDGERSLYVDAQKLLVTDMLPVTTMELMNFDSKGNILFFDPVNYAIRRININS
jgi:hypothetical protein